MAAFIKNLTFDCQDALRPARFWAAALAEEVERLRGLGATVLERYDGITGMADPEGNEFCVEPGPGDPHPPSGR
jgi:glyoxalase superfamily protein